MNNIILKTLTQNLVYFFVFSQKSRKREEYITRKRKKKDEGKLEKGKKEKKVKTSNDIIAGNGRERFMN